MNKNSKYLKIELDIYERKYVTINDLKYITYCDAYINGYIGKRPPHNYDGFSNISFGEYPDMYNEINGTRFQPSSYKDICVSYVKRLLLLFDRIKGHFRLITPTRFGKEEVIKIYWRILNDVSYFKRFLKSHYKFRKVVEEKMIEFEHEVKHERGRNKIPLQNLNCLKARVVNSVLT